MIRLKNNRIFFQNNRDNSLSKIKTNYSKDQADK